MQNVQTKRDTPTLLSGPILQALVRFAFPLLASGLIQMLYSTVDLIFAGNYIGKFASASIGSSAILVNSLVGFFSGLAVGAGVVISQHFGAGNHEKLQKAVHTAVTISFASGVAVMLLGFLLSPLFLTWMNTPAGLLPHATAYVRIYFFSMVPLILYNIGSSIMRAVGNSRRPMYILLAGAVCNIVLDWLFVAYFSFGIAGTGWATVISQTATALLILFNLMRESASYRLMFRKLGIDKTELMAMLKIGIPAGIQSILMSFSNIVAQYHINGFGEDVIAAFSAYVKIELLVYWPMSSMGQAITTFTGQNVGARQWGRIRKGLRTGLIFIICVSITIGALMSLTKKHLFALFNPDPTVIAYGATVLSIIAPFYFLYSIMEALSGTLRGRGYSFAPMCISIFSLCIFRSVLLTALLQWRHELKILAAVYPITWAVTSFCFFIYYMRVRNRQPA